MVLLDQNIGNYLIVLAVAVMASAIVVVAIFRGNPILTTRQFAPVLTVAAIPVAMPTAPSVMMAVGARLHMLRGRDGGPGILVWRSNNGNRRGTAMRRLPRLAPHRRAKAARNEFLSNASITITTAVSG